MSNNKNILFLREEYGNGQGTYIYPNGEKYVGEYNYGKRWKGTDYDKNGNIIGKVVNGEQQ